MAHNYELHMARYHVIITSTIICYISGEKGNAAVETIMAQGQVGDPGAPGTPGPRGEKGFTGDAGWFFMMILVTHSSEARMFIDDELLTVTSIWRFKINK